jgi:hypothetical protein
VDADFVMPIDEEVASWYNNDKLLVLYVWWIEND